MELRGVSKRYTKYVDTPMLLTTAARFRADGRREKLWAVRGVDLQVAEGESLGVIGRNGSGKTTLVSMLAGITAPTEGSVRVRGRVAPLIAVGVGFHRELTGRENIYVNGAILGLSRRQVHARLEEIVEFAEVSSFLDTPVKFYSSGMYVRLGFAVAAHAEPEVLIVDEVLAVGDFAFQLKCFEKMNEIRSRGTTLVMVSHHLGVVRRMCDRVLLMHEGRPQLVAPPEEAIARFHQLLSSSQGLQVDDSSGLRFEPRVVEIESVSLADGRDHATSHFEAGEQIAVRVRARAHAPLDDAVVALTVFAGDGTAIYADSTAGQIFGAVAAGRRFGCTLTFPARFATGSYQVGVRIDRPDLRTTLATSPPAAFFVTGRHTVSGVTDLEARIVRDDPLGDEPLVAAEAAGGVGADTVSAGEAP